MKPKVQEFASVRLAAEDLEVIRKLAAAEERSLSQMIRLLLRDGLRARRQDTTGPPSRKKPQ